jgi:hypothetical protein
MFQYPHGNFPSSAGLFSRGKLRLAHFLLHYSVYKFSSSKDCGSVMVMVSKQNLCCDNNWLIFKLYNIKVKRTGLIVIKYFKSEKKNNFRLFKKQKPKYKRVR